MKRFVYLAFAAMMLFVGCATQKKAVETEIPEQEETYPVEIVEKVLTATGKGENKDWNTAKAMARINVQGELSEQFKTAVQTFASSHAVVSNVTDKTNFERLIDTYSRNVLQNVEYVYTGDNPMVAKKKYTILCTGTMNTTVVKKTIEGILNDYPAEERASYRQEMYEVFGLDD